MENHPEKRSETPFDERAALRELERLREQIERYRSQRKATIEEFDRFVDSFKAGTAVPTPTWCTTS